MSFQRMRKHFRKGIAAMVYRQDENIEYLLVHSIGYPADRWRGWGIIKGAVKTRAEKKLSEIELLKKELEEEAKIKDSDIIKIEKIPNLRIKYEFPNRKQRRYICIGQEHQVYAVEVDPEIKVQLDYRENDDFIWREFPEAKRILKFDDVKEALEGADKFIEKLRKREKSSNP